MDLYTQKWSDLNRLIETGNVNGAPLPAYHFAHVRDYYAGVMRGQCGPTKPVTAKTRPTFDYARAALKEYDRTAHLREAAWRRVKSNKDVDACVAADHIALRRVQDALWKDTSDRNHREYCWLVDIDTIRAWVEGKPTP